MPPNLCLIKNPLLYVSRLRTDFCSIDWLLHNVCGAVCVPDSLFPVYIRGTPFLTSADYLCILFRLNI